MGSGRVDLTKAALAGLTLDETYANFVAADPAVGTVAMKDLNLAVGCATPAVTRAARGHVRSRTSWARAAGWNATAAADTFGLTVSPSSFTLGRRRDPGADDHGDADRHAGG